MKKIGITTTVPIEVLIAAGYNPIDINNIFVTSENHLDYIDKSEKDGFPKSLCAWIKGIYGATLDNDINEILGVIGGECSNSKALSEVLSTKGVKITDFSYPHSHNINDLKIEINKIIDIYKTDLDKVEEVRVRLNKIRDLATEVDKLTYIENKATGFENHLLQLCCSDFDGDYLKYEDFLKMKIREISKRDSKQYKIRLGYIGVPPMTGDIFEFVNLHDANFVFNEVQREFAFPRAKEAKDIYEQYHDYTYPYDFDFRIKKVIEQIKLRKLDGIIHYTQAFCYRAIEDIMVKNSLDIPVLNIEGDKLTSLDARTKLRIEAFVDMLKDKKVMES